MTLHQESLRTLLHVPFQLKLVCLEPVAVYSVHNDQMPLWEKVCLTAQHCIGVLLILIYSQKEI